MNFDYKTLYQNYKNEDLLLIVNKPEQYQAEAVSAAKDILKTRDVSREEEANIERVIYNEESNRKIKEDSKNALKTFIKSKLEYLVNPIKHPNKKISTLYWVVIFVIIQAVYYIIDLPSTIQGLYSNISNFSFGDSYSVFNITLNLVIILYSPYLWYLLLSRKKLGWILLTTATIQSAFSIPRTTYNLYLYSQLTEEEFSFTNNIISACITILLLFFLLKKDSYTFFSITKPVRNKAVLYTSIIFILISLFSFML